MAGRHTRNLIRSLIAAALTIALLTSATAPLPEELPTLAFQQAGLYRLEIALLVFYGSLLMITPAVFGLAWGRLPTEISTRGAKFAERTYRSAELDEAEIRRLELDLKDLADGLSEAKIEINRLKMQGDDK